MLGDSKRRKLIRESIKNGNLNQNATPEALAKLFSVEETVIAEYQLLVSVVGVEEFNTVVKQGRSIVTDPEGDGYAVDAGKKIKVTVSADDKELVFSYVADCNKDLEFNFEENVVIEK